METWQLIIPIILALIVNIPTFIIGILNWHNNKKTRKDNFINKDRELDLGEMQLSKDVFDSLVAKYEGLVKTALDMKDSIERISKENEEKYKELEQRYANQGVAVAQLKISIGQLQIENERLIKKIEKLEHDNAELGISTKRTLNSFARQLKEFCKREIEQLVKEAIETIRLGPTSDSEQNLLNRLSDLKQAIDTFELPNTDQDKGGDASPHDTASPEGQNI